MVASVAADKQQGIGVNTVAEIIEIDDEEQPAGTRIDNSRHVFDIVTGTAFGLCLCLAQWLERMKTRWVRALNNKPATRPSSVSGLPPHPLGTTEKPLVRRSMPEWIKDHENMQIHPARRETLLPIC